MTDLNQRPSTAIPAEGSRIRVTHTQTPQVFEGVVAGYDPLTGCVRLTDGQVVAVESGDHWTITVEVIDPALPEEPREGALRRGNTGDLWRRRADGWYLMVSSELSKPRKPTTWADLHVRYGPLVPMVAKPDLAELVEATRWLLDDVCQEAECLRPQHAQIRAVLAKVAGEVTA